MENYTFVHIEGTRKHFTCVGSYYKDEEVARTYDALWKQADAWCCDNLKDKDAEYYFRTTDEIN